MAVRLRAEGRPLQAAASEALSRGIGDSAVLDEDGSQPYAAGYRPLALTISAPARESVAWLARAAFNGDERAAVGWLLARGVGIRMGLPAAEGGSARARAARGSRGMAGMPGAATTGLLKLRRPAGPITATPSPKRRRASTAAAEVDAPNGEELRQMREALGIAQRELAAHAGLSRGLVAEVERGRRANGLTRLRLFETLRSLQRAS